MRVLYVDPDDEHTNLATEMINGEVEVASSIEEAREKYDGQKVVSEYLFREQETGVDLMDEVNTDFSLYTAYNKNFVERDSGRSLVGVDFVKKGSNSWDELNQWLDEN